MKFNEYQKLASSTAPDPTKKNFANFSSKEAMTLCAALGLSGESGELADAVKKHFFQGHALEKDTVKKELGDILWYVSAMAGQYGLTLEEIAEANVEKLKKRYPDGFSEQNSLNRIDVEQS